MGDKRGEGGTALPAHSGCQGINLAPLAACGCGTGGCLLLGTKMSSGRLFLHPRLPTPPAWRRIPPRLCGAGREWCQVQLHGNARPLFTVFMENKPPCPPGCRRGRLRAWERGGRWLPFPGCRQLAVAMASVCFPFLPALERKARVAACLFLNYKKVEKGLTCTAVPAAGLGQWTSLFAARMVLSHLFGLGSP